MGPRHSTTHHHGHFIPARLPKNGLKCISDKSGAITWWAKIRLNSIARGWCRQRNDGPCNTEWFCFNFLLWSRHFVFVSSHPMASHCLCPVWALEGLGCPCQIPPGFQDILVCLLCIIRMWFPHYIVYEYNTYDSQHANTSAGPVLARQRQHRELKSSICAAIKGNGVCCRQSNGCMVTPVSRHEFRLLSMLLRCRSCSIRQQSNLIWHLLDMKTSLKLNRFFFWHFQSDNKDSIPNIHLCIHFPNYSSCL